MKRILVASLAVVAVCLSGCSGSADRPAQAEPDPPVSATPTPTTTGRTEPVMPASARQQTKAGAVAFAGYFWRVVNYATASGDSKQLSSLQAPWCRSCTAGLKWIRKIYARHGMIRGGTHRTTLVGVDRLPSSTRTGLAFSIVLRVTSAAETVSGAGDLDGRTPAGASKMVMAIQALRGHWEVATCVPSS